MSILENYLEKCSQTNGTANKSLIRVLQQLTEIKTTTFSLTFKGNDKYNFTNRLKDEDFIFLMASVTDRVENIVSMDFSYNLLTDISIFELARLLPECTQLKSLNFEGNDIGSSGVSALADGLQSNKTIEELNLNSNKMKTDGAMKIVELLFTNTSLQKLDIGNNEIDHDGIIGLTSVLNWNNSTLTTLNLDKPVYPSIGQETAIHFGKMLQSNRSLEKLSLRKHSFTCDAIYIITEHLLENSKLRVLDLTANRISFNGCEALAKYLLGEFCSLESLILTSNRLGHYGAKAMAKAIAGNKTLVHLDMTRCDIDDNGLRMIAESLKENNGLASVKLFWNHFDQGSLKVFHEIKERKRKNDWFWDFVTYMIDGHYEMAYYETKIPYDINI